MARPEPNICSQKCGKGWEGAEESIVTTSLGTDDSSGDFHGR